MISELRFAAAYHSMWSSLAPTMDFFVRKANLRLYKRNWDALTSRAAPEARSLINRVAFRSLVDAVNVTPTIIDRAQFVRDHVNLSSAEHSLTGKNILSPADLHEASLLAERMCVHLFQWRSDTVMLCPRYQGCGIINTCVGDAISDKEHIIELKDGDRPFRSIDFRQVTVYGALHLNSTGRLPPACVVINSRRGVSLEVSIDTLAEEVAGQCGYEYLREVIRVISDATISG